MVSAAPNLPLPGAVFDAEVLVRRRIAARAESGWALLEVDWDGDDVALVGPLAHLEERERAHVVGRWVDDRRYGLQVRVTEARPLPPSTRDAIESYLRKTRHVGAARARKLLERHGDGVLEAIDADPLRAFAAAGLGATRLREAARSWDALRASRELHLLLAPEGLGYLVARIRREYGDRAHRIVRQRPYELTSVFGVGFRIADRIARRVGVDPDTPARARAGVLHVLAEAEQGGSTCLPAGLLLQRARELLGDAAVLDAELLQALGERGDVELAGELVARAATAALEAELAGHVKRLLGGRADAVAVPDAPAPDTEFVPAPAQWQAVQAAFAGRLSLITGGPGTGKTATIRAIAAAAAEQGLVLALVAPTGRAALRMAEATGAAASTVHSALAWIPGMGPEHGEEDPLECDLLVLDEASMANLELLVFLLRAVGDATHVVLVGDADQLAPVGAGKPFAELIASGQVPTARLEHIFRQAAGSMIVQGAHAVRAGRPPSFRRVEGMEHDLYIAERPVAAAALDEVVSLVAERLPRRFGVDPVDDIQVFAPVYRGALGIDALNERLRAALNPHGTPVLGGRFRSGDKLMLTGRNLHDLGLMNGTLLRLLGDRGEGDDAALTLQADDGTTFTLTGEDRDRLTLAYACSIHKGQGIELPVAVVIAHPAAGAFFLRREMLYTAITRARRATVVVGTAETLARAAASTDTERRFTQLARRLG